MKTHLIPLLFLVQLASITCGFSTHYAGLTFRYECLDSCTYRLFIGGYFDCSHPGTASNLPFNPSNPPLFFYNVTFETIDTVSSGNCALPSYISGSGGSSAWLELSPICPNQNTACNSASPSVFPGFLYAESYKDYNFCSSNCTSFKAYIEPCCRNVNFTSFPAQTGPPDYVEIIINRDSFLCNSSPSAPPFEEVFLCDNQVNFMDLSQIDPEGDSLVYSLGDCLESDTVSLPYLSGYNGANPFGSNWITSLDPQTGILCASPQPGSLEKVMICIFVDEYRNGNWLGRTQRLITGQILDCGTQQFPVLDTVMLKKGLSWVNGDLWANCGGTPLEFEIVFSDGNIGDSLDISVVAQNDSLIYPGINLSYSGGNPISATFSWTPTSDQINQDYNILIKAKDNSCPLPGKYIYKLKLFVDDTCISSSLTYPPCSNITGAIDLMISPNLPGPYQFLWSNGDTTQNLTGVSSGFYWVDVIGFNGQIVSDSFFLNGDDLIVLDSLINPDCYDDQGKIMLNINGGLSPYQYNWTTGDTTAMIDSLFVGGYAVDITDSQGCFTHQTYLLDFADTCINVVKGRIYVDENNNCVQDSGEIGIPNLLIYSSQGTGTITNYLGDYDMIIDTGEVEIFWTFPAGLIPSCQGGDTLAFSFLAYGNELSHADFSVTLDSTVDLKINMYSTPFRPGFIANFGLNLSNNSYSARKLQVYLEIDSQFTFVNSSLPPSSYDSINRTLFWETPLVQPFGSQTILGNLFTKVSSQIGDSLTIKTRIEPIAADAFPLDNEAIWTSAVVGAFDPNDKLVSPTGIGSPGYIQRQDSLLTYTIRFQNTGNYPATYVIIRDTLSALLEVTSLQMKGASHDYTAKIEEGNILEVRFDHIQLPDSLSDPIGSQGFVSFGIKQAPNLAMGTVIENQAAIYFDFNDPVITASVINTIYVQPEISIQSPDSLCEEDQIPAFLITEGMPPFQYAWQDGTTSLDSGIYNGTDAFSSGWYVVTVIDAFGFEAKDSFYVEVAPLPIAAFSATPKAAYQVQFQNQSQFGDSYLWNFGNGHTSTGENPQFSFGASGTFKVELIVQNECGKDTFSTKVILYTTGLAEEFSRNWQAYPVPFEDSWILERTGDLRESVSLEVLNAQGRRVYFQAKMQGLKTNISSENWPSGMYVLHISGEGTSVTRRLWKR